MTLRWARIGGRRMASGSMQVCIRRNRIH